MKLRGETVGGVGSTRAAAIRIGGWATRVYNDVNGLLAGKRDVVVDVLHVVALVQHLEEFFEARLVARA